MHLFLGGPPSYATLVVVVGGDVRLTKRRVELEGTELKEVGGRETILTQHSHHQNDTALTAVSQVRIKVINWLDVCNLYSD